jgi:hypothetical protein
MQSLVGFGSDMDGEERGVDEGYGAAFSSIRRWSLKMNCAFK